VLLYADDIITNSSFSNEKKIISFAPEPRIEPKTEGHIPSEIYGDNASLSESSSGSSSSSSSSSWTVQISEDGDDSPHQTKPPLPIDIQFSIPAMAILVLYCFGHLSFFELTNLFLDSFGDCMHPRNANIIILAVGFLLLRLSGDLWYWTSLVDSEPLSKCFKATKQYRLRLAQESTRISSSMGESSDTVNCVKLSKLENLKRAALIQDIHTMKWFKRHERLTMVISLLGFYFTYIPATFFYTETCLWFAALPRHEVISGLPSLKLTEGVINASPIFRSMLATGPTPLLSKDEMDIWMEKVGVVHTKPDMALRHERASEGSFTSSTCSATNGTLESFLALEDDLYYADAEYLNAKLSKASSGLFFGDPPAYFVTTKGMLVVNCFVFGCSMLLLSKAKVPFFAI